MDTLSTTNQAFDGHSSMLRSLGGDVQNSACSKSEILSGATSSTSLIEAAQALGPLIQAYAEETERLRQIPGPVIEAMMRAGFFGWCMPRELGGNEGDPITLMQIVETVSKVDGSVAWCLMIGATYGVLAGYLPSDIAREIYKEPCVIAGGSLQPTGSAIIVDGGCRVTGRWPVEGSYPHCKWLVGGCHILDGDKPRASSDGLPIIEVLFFPVRICKLLETYGKTGLRGTGNHDYSIDDLFVSARYAISILAPATVSRALYAFPVLDLFSSLAGAVALGIARHAMETLLELSSVKITAGSQRELREDAGFQAGTGHVEALIRSARGFLYETVEKAWELVKARQTIRSSQRTMLSLAATHATNAAKTAVDRLSSAFFAAGGSSPMYTRSGLERCVRDIQTLAQHDCVRALNYETAGLALISESYRAARE